MTVLYVPCSLDGGLPPPNPASGEVERGRGEAVSSQHPRQRGQGAEGHGCPSCQFQQRAGRGGQAGPPQPPQQRATACESAPGSTLNPTPGRCRANLEHTSQSRPDSGLGLSHFAAAGDSGQRRGAPPTAGWSAPKPLTPLSLTPAPNPSPPPFPQPHQPHTPTPSTPRPNPIKTESYFLTTYWPESTLSS